MNIEFGNKIRQLREEKRKTNPAFSLRRFAQAVDVSPAFLSKLELGESLPPGAEKIKKMAGLLGVDPDELLSLAGKVDPSLPIMIRERPPMADFLRSANEHLSDKELEELTERIKKGEIC